MSNDDFLKECEEEMLEFDWVVLEFRKQFNIKLEERGFEE